MFISSDFRPGWWCKNRHVQTIWATVFRRLPELPSMCRWRLELQDGDFIDVDLYLKKYQVNQQQCGQNETKNDCSTVLLLHGLEGSTDSHYMRGIIERLAREGKQIVVMHFRGCSGESNRLLRSYHSGVSEDLHEVIEKLAERGVRIDYLVGFSLGGNVLLKWLGEERSNFGIKAAVAVSVPLQLDECANAIEKGFSRVYSSRLLKTLKIKTQQKKKQFIDQLPLDENEIARLNTFWDFDENVTAPLHGFESASDYYLKVSGRQYLRTISVPTLVVHAKDDPFMNTRVIPSAHELSPNVHFELSDNGGHVGFVEGRWPWQADYYLERRIPEFLDQYS